MGEYPASELSIPKYLFFYHRKTHPSPFVFISKFDPGGPKFGRKNSNRTTNSLCFTNAINAVVLFEHQKANRPIHAKRDAMRAAKRFLPVMINSSIYGHNILSVVKKN